MSIVKENIYRRSDFYIVVACFHEKRDEKINCLVDQ